MFKYASKPIKILFISLISVFILIIIAFISTQISHIGRHEISVHFAPFTSTIKLNNGQTLRNDAKNYIEPGEYEVTISCDHFETKTQQITIDDDTKFLIGNLIPNDEEGEQIAKNRQSDFQKVEGIAGQIASEQGSKNKEKHPILNYLPINNSLYSISYKYDENLTPKITIKADPKYYDVAVKKLYTLKDITPSDYEILIQDLKNPLENPVENQNTDPLKFIKASFPKLSTSFQFNTGTKIDEYYISTVSIYDYDLDLNYSHFRIILKKTDSSWAFTTTPNIILTKFNSPNVPENILEKANQL